MAELKLLAGSVPSGTPYPPTFNAFLRELSSYLSVSYPDEFRTAVVSITQPSAADQNKVWFKLSPEDGLPKTINLFVDGEWLEFTELTFGDMVLVPSTSNIRSPWGEGAASYTVNGVQKLTPATPTPPNGFKYKVYVGNYI